MSELKCEVNLNAMKLRENAGRVKSYFRNKKGIISVMKRQISVTKLQICLRFRIKLPIAFFFKYQNGFF